MKQKKWFFSQVEEALLNQSFSKKHPNYCGGRIEIYHRDEPYDVEEIRLLLPCEIFNAIREAIDFKEVDYFQIGHVHSEELEEFIKSKNEKRKKKKN